MKQFCSLFGSDNAEMAPKRPKGRTYYPTVLLLYGLLKSQIDQPEQDGAIRLGGYCSRPGPFPAVIRQWLPTLQALLSACPSALISWSRLKAAFRKLFEEKPSSDPHLKSAEFTPFVSGRVRDSSPQFVLRFEKVCPVSGEEISARGVRSFACTHHRCGGPWFFLCCGRTGRVFQSFGRPWDTNCTAGLGRELPRTTSSHIGPASFRL